MTASALSRVEIIRSPTAERSKQQGPPFPPPRRGPVCFCRGTDR